MKEQMLSIGERLTEERKRLGFTQAEIAKKVGLSVKSQNNYEANKRSPDAAYWSALGMLYRVDIQYILVGVPSTNLDEISEQTPADIARRKKAATRRVMKIVERRSRKPDTLQLGPLRDLVYSARLNDEQIKQIFQLMEVAREDGFWLDKA